MTTVLLTLLIVAALLLVGMGLLAYGASQDIKAGEFDSVFDTEDDYL